MTAPHLDSPDPIENLLRRGEWIELTACSEEKVIARIEHIFDGLCESRISSADRHSLRLALREMCSNAIEWGNRGDASRKIRVSCCLFDEKLVLKIEDEGEGFDPTAIADPTSDHLRTLEDRLAENKRFGGYGLLMARRIMDQVIHSDRGNVVLLSKNLPGRRG